MTGRVTKLLRSFHEQLFKYAWKFGLVGLVGFAVDVAIFNLLRSTVLDPTQVPNGSLWANVVSTIVATIVAWLGNRFWAFREHRRKNFWLELLEFGTASAIGLGITTLCLYISHNVMGLTDSLSDNISKNVVGLTLATLSRFAMYRFLVFSPARKDGHSRLQQDAAARALDEAAIVAAIDPAAADFLGELANEARRPSDDGRALAIDQI